MPKVYIIILNYKNWQDTIECLGSVFRSTYTNFSVIVIDNDSQNESIENLVNWANEYNKSTTTEKLNYTLLQRADIDEAKDPALFSRLTFIQNDINGGFAAGNNIALSVLVNEDACFWLLNPDITIQDDTLEELTRFAAQQPMDAIIGGVIRSAGNHELLFYGGATINYMTSTITPVKRISLNPMIDYIHGACFFSHASNLKRTGLLPEQYFLYWEESDWCYHARLSGSGFFVCPKAVCYDKISTTIGRGFLADYYYVRNGLFFISKYRKKNLPFVIFFNVLRFFKRVFTGKWKKASGVVKGTVDFFKMKKA